MSQRKQNEFGLLKDRLSFYHTKVLERLTHYTSQMEPKEYLYELVEDYPRRGGKGFRPGICLATTKIFGGHIEMAMNSALTLELLHNAFLVHDDIEDESLFRRGKATLHQLHGVSIAINVGDAMNAISLRPLMQNLELLGPQLSWEIFTEIEHMVRQSVEGQALELGWRKDNCMDLQSDDYLNMILKKTCWYTCIHPFRIGALIGQGGSENLDQFNRFGFFLGAAFQIQDDLLNLEGDIDKYGKEIGGDLLEGKRTLMMIHLINECDQKEKKDIADFLSSKRKNYYDREAVEWLLELMNKYGSLEYAKASAQRLAGAALNEYTRVFGVFPPSEEREFIEELVLYMIKRDY